MNDSYIVAGFVVVGGLLPASVIAGVLWQGVGAWSGFGPAAPFAFGAALAVGLFVTWVPGTQRDSSSMI